MVVKTAKWESELWSYLSKGDGEHCPFRSHCQAKESGLLCADDCKTSLSQLFDSDDQFDPHKFNLEFPEPEEYRKDSLFYLVEKLAQKQLIRGKVRCPPVPINLVSLTDEHHSIEVRLLPLKAYHGCIWHPKEGWVIQLKADDTPAAKRFTLFHEAFHILAHCESSPVFRKRGVTQGSFNELLADFFAICILMPEQWVMEKWTGVKDLDQMAEIFDVPKAAMWFRLKQLGLV